MDTHAGLCRNGRKNHAWERKAYKRAPGLFYGSDYHACRYCDRVKVVEYTLRGNHVAGYMTADPVQRLDDAQEQKR